MPPNNSAHPCTSRTSFPQAGELTSPPLEVWPGPGAALSRGTQRSDVQGLWAQARVSPAPFPPYLGDSVAMPQWNVRVEWGSHGPEWRPLRPCCTPTWQLRASLDEDPQTESHQPPQWHVEETGAAHGTGPGCQITNKEIVIVLSY